MDETTFWDLVEVSKTGGGGDCTLQAEILEERLTRLSNQEIIDCDRVVDRLMTESYRANLWDAAYLINGGCSNDGFDYFRGWLMAQGRKAFYDALQDPESLLHIAEPEVECEAMLYVASAAYEAKTGSPMPTNRTPSPDITVRERTDDELKSMYPKLYARFGPEGP